MFDVGFSELLIIAVVALLVLGPERLPKAARLAGLWVRKARAQWYSVKSELELELAQEEMKKHLQEAENSIRAPMQELQQDLRQAEDGLNAALTDLARSAEAEPDVGAGNAIDTTPDPAAFEADEPPPPPAQPMPDGPIDGGADPDGPDGTHPKQGALW